MGVGRATEVVDHITMPFTAYEYTVSFWGDHTTARVSAVTCRVLGSSMYELDNHLSGMPSVFQLLLTAQLQCYTNLRP